MRLSAGRPAVAMGSGSQSLALAMVQPDLATPGTKLMIDILDQRLPVTVIAESPYDPDNENFARNVPHAIEKGLGHV